MSHTFVSIEAFLSQRILSIHLHFEVGGPIFGPIDEHIWEKFYKMVKPVGTGLENMPVFAYA